VQPSKEAFHDAASLVTSQLSAVLDLAELPAKVSPPSWLSCSEALSILTARGRLLAMAMAMTFVSRPIGFSHGQAPYFRVRKTAAD
jgi:hypothetical protein